MIITNKIIQERDDMIYGRRPRDEKRIRKINEEIKRQVISKQET